MISHNPCNNFPNGKVPTPVSPYDYDSYYLYLMEQGLFACLFVYSGTPLSNSLITLFSLLLYWNNLLLVSFFIVVVLFSILTSSFLIITINTTNNSQIQIVNRVLCWESGKEKQFFMS